MPSTLPPPALLKATAEVWLRRALQNPDAEFREGQWEAIASLVRDRARLLVVQRTGWGKSMVYFLATRLLRDRHAGPTLLISPLLALMRNQIVAAERIGLRAETINSSNVGDWKRVQQAMLQGEIDLLLVSPERLANDDFREHVLMPVAGRIGLLVVDEAHCISDWGHDFRPDYRRIVRIVQAMPATVPVLTTTATANDRVVEDVREQLGTSLRILRGPLGRESLRLQNIWLPDQAARLAWLAQYVPKLPGSGIIYTLTVRDAQRVAQWLQSKQVDAHAYYGELETTARENLEGRLLANRLKALVATPALGLGFDKPDLGFVVHFQRPGSIIHYYQQVGRAGRALKTAYGIMLSGEEDKEISDYFIATAFPPESHVDEVLSALAHEDEGLSVPGLAQKLNLAYAQIEKVLKVLATDNPSPVSKIDAKWHLTPVRYRPDRAKIERLIQHRYREQERMKDYLQSKECLMAMLRRELDDPMPEPCGKCAPCAGKPIIPETFSAEVAAEATRFLRRGDYVIEPRLRGHDAKTIPEDLRAEPGRSLCAWGDAGWGNLAKDGKHQGHFADELVNAAAELIRERWKPQPFPAWITCVPSVRHPVAVADFAERLAKLLKLPLIGCVRRTREAPAQKGMHNSFQQAQNVEGAYDIDRKLVKTAPVLLVDDMVDSRWTFTVIVTLLRQAGSGPVFPFAIAQTTGRRD